MAETYVTFTGDNSTTDFVYNFKTISTAHTKVSVDGVVQTTGFSLLGSSGSGSPSTDTGGMVRFDSAPAVSAVVTVYRETPIVSEGLPVDFVDGSILTEADLDKNFNSLLYAAQEEVEDSGITLDPSYVNWDAENKKITGGIAGTSSTDFVTVQQLEQVELYGPQAAPQGWAFTTTSAAQTVFVLDSTSGTGGSDLPSSTNNNLYIVEVGGVIQRATTDFTVALDTDGQYKLTLTSGLDEANVPVIVRNFGVSRQIIEQPLIPDGVSAVGLKLQANTSQSGDMLQVNASDGTTQMMAVEADGDLVVGTDTKALNTLIQKDLFEIGDVNTGLDTSGIALNHVDQSESDGRPAITTQAKAAAAAASVAFQVYHGTAQKLSINYEGDVSCTDVTASGNITATGDVTCDDVTVNATGTGLKVGGGFGNTGCTIDSGGKIETDSYIVADHISVSEGSGNGIQSTEYNGYIQFTSGGPALVHNTGATYVKAMSNRILINNGSDSTGTQLDGVKAPTSDLHAANKAYADTGRWLFKETVTLNVASDWAAISSGYSSYDRVRLVFSNLQPQTGSTASHFYFKLMNDSSGILSVNSSSNNDLYDGGEEVRSDTTGHVGEVSYIQSGNRNFEANPLSGQLTIDNIGLTAAPSKLELFATSDDLPDGNKGVWAGLVTADNAAAIDHVQFLFGDSNSNTKYGVTGTVTIYTFKYPTS